MLHIPCSLTVPFFSDRGKEQMQQKQYQRRKDVQYFWALLQPVVIVHLDNSRVACNFSVFYFWCICFPYSCPIFSWTHINFSKIFQMSAPLLLLLFNLNPCAENQVLGLEAWLMLKNWSRMRSFWYLIFLHFITKQFLYMVQRQAQPYKEDIYQDISKCLKSWHLLL